MIRNTVSVLVQSVRYSFPSEDSNFSCPIFSDNSEYPSFSSFFFRSFQYFRGLSVPVRASTTSVMENHHSLLWIVFLTCFPLKTAIFVVSINQAPVFSISKYH